MSTGLLRFITAGSVDDGKSTLIGRMLFDSKGLFADQLGALEAASRKRGFAEIDLSLLTDGLLAEREQGITIDVAYRYFATPARKFIIGDCPGHEQYTRNMVTAASTADVAVLLVDARHGLRAQTHRHAYLARWLGVPRIVLAVNKMDLVDGERVRFEEIRDEFEQFAQPLGFAQVRAIPLSALRGDMVVERGDALRWYDGPTLIEYLENVPARHDDARSALARAAHRGAVRAAEFGASIAPISRSAIGDDTAARTLHDSGVLRFPVQRVARVKLGNEQQGAELTDGEFRGYQGTIASGVIRTGDDVVAWPSKAHARVAEILTADGPLAEAGADQAITLRLDREIDLSRGDLLASPARPPRVSQSIDADLCWFDAEPLAPGRIWLVKHGTQTVRARVERIDWRVDVTTLERLPGETTLAMNDVARVRIATQRALAFDAYEDNRATGAFIVIDEASNRTVAAGTIVRDDGEDVLDAAEAGVATAAHLDGVQP